MKTCGDCHGKEPKDNDLDLTSFGSAQAIIAKPKLLGDVAERLRLGDMPPKEARSRPRPSANNCWAGFRRRSMRKRLRQAGDPGPVTLRRLSNTEYDNSIRDLTGVDLRPTQAREFPADSVGGEGFANVGDAMPVTPGLVERFITKPLAMWPRGLYCCRRASAFRRRPNVLIGPRTHSRQRAIFMLVMPVPMESRRSLLILQRR